MPTNTQFIFDALITITLLSSGWVLRILWTSIRELQQVDSDLAKDVRSIEVLVAGEYVKRDELAKHLDRIDNKLDKIYAKIEEKADK